jgi:hypothetical protein
LLETGRRPRGRRLSGFQVNLDYRAERRKFELPWLPEIAPNGAARLSLMASFFQDRFRRASAATAVPIPARYEVKLKGPAELPESCRLTTLFQSGVFRPITTPPGLYIEARQTLL